MTKRVSHEMEAHPDAAIFPMMPEDELNELADDIKTNGQQMPILVQDGLIIDGRNRYAACLRAGVNPVFEEFSGTDVKAFIVSANINRRHMTKGARAMAVAKMYPDALAYKRGGNSLKIKESGGFTDGYLSQARTVLHHTPELADKVLSGLMPLSGAYEEAKKTKAKADSVEERINALRLRYSDLADKVLDGELSIEAAQVEADSRDRVERDRIAAIKQSVSALQTAARLIGNDRSLAEICDYLLSLDGYIEPDVRTSSVLDVLADSANRLNALYKASEVKNANP